MMISVVSEFNPQQYGKLLAKVRPRVIRTAEENDRVLTLVEQLMAKGKTLTLEEGELLKLLGQLIADFEQDFHDFEDAKPHEVVQELMDARGLKQSDLSQLFGSKRKALEVMNGKRGISESQAKALSRLLHVSAELFI